MSDPSSQPNSAGDARKRQPPPPVMRMTLQGATPDLSDQAARATAMAQAFDYRGDVTVHTTDGRVIEGYVYDRTESGADGGGAAIRIMPADGGRVTLRYDEIERLEFTGRDAAEGRSWDTWVKKYVEKKLAGESASIEPEALEE